MFIQWKNNSTRNIFYSVTPQYKRCVRLRPI